MIHMQMFEIVLMLYNVVNFIIDSIHVQLICFINDELFAYLEYTIYT